MAEIIRPTGDKITTVTVGELIKFLQQFDSSDPILIYDRDMLEYSGVKFGGRRTRAPICVQLTVERN